MKKVIKLKESDLARMVKQIMKESKYDFDSDLEPQIMEPDTDTDTQVDVPNRDRETRKNPFIMPRRNDEEDPLPDLEPQGRLRRKPMDRNLGMRKLRGESKDLDSIMSKYLKNKREK